MNRTQKKKTLLKKWLFPDYVINSKALPDVDSNE